uniref:Phosphatidylinositol-3,4-bisphosphate 4-phosphatase n=1 Tax=Odontella aurita TaxID=265563 RepID=A0A7S4IA47_9STRA|mmetsp:Transcript_22003/g.65140  ORF Transcript_22003/g.65140 Transcript_22003/m.65140 type:complete len:1493 (+) Transcript_22003:294-4772(+)
MMSDNPFGDLVPSAPSAAPPAAAGVPPPPPPPSSSSSSLGAAAAVPSPTSGISEGGGGGKSWSPIVTLEKQYARPVGRRLTMIVRANGACYVDGGVEAVLKSHNKRRGSGGVGGAAALEPAATSGDGNPFGQSTPSSSSSSSSSSAPSSGNGVDLLRFDSALSLGDGNGDGSVPHVSAADDPFGLMAAEAEAAAPPMSEAPGGSYTPQQSASSSSHGEGGGKGGGGRGGNKKGAFFSKLKGAARTAQAHVERGVTTIAIKAEGAGKMGGSRKPDRLSAGVYLVRPATAGHRQRETCLGATDEIESAPGNAAFAAPLVLPPEGSLPPETVLTFRLLIRSGATLLAKAMQKNFCVGEGYARVGDLFGALRRVSGGPGTMPFAAVSIPLRGPALEGGGGAGAAAFEIVVMPDLKHPSLCGPGWTLSDPRSDTAYVGSVTGGRLHNFPLDGTYAYPLDRTSSISAGNEGNVLVATERCTESAVVLPLAAAVAKAMSDASAISSRHAADVLRTLRGGGIYAGDDPLQAMETGVYAQCQVEIKCLVLQRQGVPAQGGQSKAAANLSLQRPDCVFETTLGRGQVPVVQLPPGSPAPASSRGATSAISVPFYPRVVTESDPSLLPGVAAASQGASLPRGGGRAFAGTVKIELREQIDPSSQGGQHGLGQGMVPNLATAASHQYQHQNSGGVGMPAGGMSGGYVPSGGAQRQMSYGPIMEGYVEIDSALNGNAGGTTINVPIYYRDNGAPAGYLVASLDASLGGMAPPSPTARSVSPARGGLISMVGMDTYAESSGCHPTLDYDLDFPSALESSHGQDADGQAALRRRKQMSTMGEFVGPEYLRRHLDRVRARDLASLSERAGQYRSALTGGQRNLDEPCNKRKDPRPFRASAGRMDAHLCGIPFNVHVHSLSMCKVGGAQGQAAPLATFHNVTHGAPSDHYRGFGGGGGGSSSDPASTSGTSGGECASAVHTALGHRGGLRRHESSRLELSSQLNGARSGLIQLVAGAFAEAGQLVRAKQAAGVPPQYAGSARHVNPDRNIAVGKARAKVRELTERLHASTWDAAVRRANCFSQALGIGATSFLAHVSDASKLSSGWADQVLRHGFLLTSEGLLSAAGKELGMIEDASVGIAMLRMVSIALVSDDGNASAPPKPGSSGRIPVPDCTYVRWIDLIPTAVGSSGVGAAGSMTRYRLEIGIDPNYHAQRVPAALRAPGAEVRFFPVLYQMGVDIHQAAANAGRNVKKQIGGGNSGSGGGGGQGSSSQPPSRQTSGVEDSTRSVEAVVAGGGELIDGDEDDDVGVPDNDVLIALNVEAFRKTNAYAHAVRPGAAASVNTWEQADAQQRANPTSFNVNPIHPSLTKLYDHIRSSAGKMEHAVLGEASSIASLLGGGGTVFCKSGKDRTAMQVTYKAARYARRYLASSSDGRRPNGDSMDDDASLTMEAVLADASLMRTRGTRLGICEKNVGQAKYAFNALQSKFMPEALKPPPGTLAGLFKGPEK